MRWAAWKVVAAVGCAACQQPVEPARPAAPVPSSAVEVLIHYGSEKASWMEEEIARFNASPTTTPSGRFIKVTGQAMGSGEAAQAIALGRARPHVFVPASSAYVALLERTWHRSEPPVSLVRSPLVVAMWQPMAKALGWPERAIGWHDFVDVNADPDGWAARGHPEWGRFKLGHTHPRHASSGLLALTALAYAGADKRGGLTPADLDAPATRAFMTEVEESVVHYGRSTGFFAEQLLAHGPTYLSAAVLYENLVIESRARAPAVPIVAVYPAEGTLWADHPYIILDAPWVGAEERAGARAFLAFLEAAPAQARARTLGFRPPGDAAVGSAAPFDRAHGVDAAQPTTTLELPGGATIDHLLALWSKVKKASTVVLVFDKSGSMDGRPLSEAKAGARAFLAALDDRDQLAVSFFDDDVHPLVGPHVVGTSREELDVRLTGAVSFGGTALYDAIDGAWRVLARRADEAPHRIYAVVVMSDGKDTDSELALSALRRHLAEPGTDDAPVRVFTIGYGAQAETAVLEGIAGASGGFHADGNVDTIVDVYRDTATLF